MKKKAIIRGEITRFVRLEDDWCVEFSVRVSSSEIGGVTFTIGTTVDFTVKRKCEGFVGPGSKLTPEPPQEPFVTAYILTVGDKVEIAMEQDENDQWDISAITHIPQHSQKVEDFLSDLEQILREHRAKHD